MDIKKWSNSDVVRWLISINMEEYIPNFKAKEITGENLFYANDDFFAHELNVLKSSDRSSMLDSIADIKQNPSFKFPAEPMPFVTPRNPFQVIPKHLPKPSQLSIPVDAPLLRLRTCQGPNEGSYYELTASRNVLGRSTEASVVTLADEHVSRKHCRITVNGDYIYIKDLGSTTGTFKQISLPVRQKDGSYVNEEVKLVNGSLFKIGLSEFKLILEDGSSCLRAYEGPLSGKMITLNKEVFTIGRAADNDCSIPTDAELSSKHATIITRENAFYIQDRNSKNKYSQLHYS
eukprot:TRINITY_DN1434_c0_g1_i17.p1 TRINITY_DN1434_c0_g1~~TRINITY_DN1434_c0_g1_i17.p1  ORF type:complete len:290 (-),score=64.91 TRINITY_DN1434_c0_g1_i17:804-1673(-)